MRVCCGEILAGGDVVSWRRRGNHFEGRTVNTDIDAETVREGIAPVAAVPDEIVTQIVWR